MLPYNMNCMQKHLLSGKEVQK
uniref:Uncharacterized protein n=1 Tax=Rhizophora mucronata TaxID=61149 RepID=A0A2P2R1H0_RHIMU